MIFKVHCKEMFRLMSELTGSSENSLIAKGIKECLKTHNNQNLEIERDNEIKFYEIFWSDVLKTVVVKEKGKSDVIFVCDDLKEG